METITIENIEYFEATNIILFEPVYCEKIKDRRDLIKKKNIDVSNYVYARLINGVWTIRTGSATKIDKLFIKKTFIDEDLNRDVVKDIEDISLIINIDDKHYYNSLYIINNAPIYCKNSRNGRQLVLNKNILEKDYVFARKVKNVWVLSKDESDKYDKVLIRRSFVKKNKILYNGLNDIEATIDIENEITITQKHIKYKKAPNIIKLEEKEKFRDDDNRVLNVETRGDKKNYTNIYFKAYAVSKELDKPNLSNSLLSKHCSYTYAKDYVYFSCCINEKIHDSTNIHMNMY